MSLSIEPFIRAASGANDPAMTMLARVGNDELPFVIQLHDWSPVEQGDGNLIITNICSLM